MTVNIPVGARPCNYDDTVCPHQWHRPGSTCYGDSQTDSPASGEQIRQGLPPSEDDWCDRHGGPWGDDETCEACVDDDGAVRPHSQEQSLSFDDVLPWTLIVGTQGRRFPPW